MASSHSSTLGPNMNCWDWRTSAIADSTSVLIKEYCALRSSRGTCMCVISFSDDFFGFQKLFWQWSIFVQVYTAQYARFHLMITVATFRTFHHAGGIR